MAARDVTGLDETTGVAVEVVNETAGVVADDWDGLLSVPQPANITSITTQTKVIIALLKIFFFTLNSFFEVINNQHKSSINIK